MQRFMVTIQGQKRVVDVAAVKQLIADNPAWGRTRISEELCREWNWQAPNGQPRDMACRTLLLKLERCGDIRLPERKRKSTNHYRNRRIIQIPHSSEPVGGCLQDLLPLSITVAAQGSAEQALFRCLLAGNHYLGLQNTVGQNMQYLVRDRHGRELACLLFGSAAWKSAARDRFIGWDAQCREAGLSLMTNNTRFLILPWVQVPHLASHILSKITKRICADWMDKYGHAVHLLETFVDKTRYRGTCYRAANWIPVGRTRGRTRNDRNNCICAPIKDIYLYPLTRKFRSRLCAAHI